MLQGIWCRRKIQRCLPHHGMMPADGLWGPRQGYQVAALCSVASESVNAVATNTNLYTTAIMRSFMTCRAMRLLSMIRGRGDFRYSAQDLFCADMPKLFGVTASGALQWLAAKPAI